MTEPILLIEDDPDAIFFFTHYSKKLGVQNRIKTLQDGAEAVAYLNREGYFADPVASPRPCAIVVDARMPKLDGFEFLQWFFEDPERGKIPVVLSSVSIRPTDLDRALAIGAKAVLEKPISEEKVRELYRVIAQWCTIVS